MSQTFTYILFFACGRIINQIVGIWPTSISVLFLKKERSKTANNWLSFFLFKTTKKKATNTIGNGWIKTSCHVTTVTFLTMKIDFCSLYVFHSVLSLKSFFKLKRGLTYKNTINFLRIIWNNVIEITLRFVLLRKVFFVILCVCTTVCWKLNDLGFIPVFMIKLSDLTKLIVFTTQSINLLSNLICSVHIFHFNEI